MLSFVRLLCVATLGLLVSACGSTTTFNFSVPNVGPSASKIPAEAKSITVSVARPDEATGPLPTASEIMTPFWKNSLEEALNREAIFEDDAPKKVSISVKILNIDFPSFGVTMTTTVGARYEVIDRSNGSIIYRGDINSTGETPLDFALVGATRAQESLNRAVQNNIRDFLQALGTIDVSKPMFPAGAAPVPPATGKPEASRSSVELKG